LIAAEKTNYPVAVMCRVLGVNRTAFHNWERRAPSDRALTDAWLTERIKRIHEHSRGVYGAPRIHAELRIEHDVRVGRKRVARLMKAAGISGVRPRKRWRTTIRIPGITPATDLVERQFRPDSPNVLWVADITYLRTGEGWLYLAAVQDAYSRAIVGWSMATHMRATLVVDALKMAIARRRPAPGLIHHSDQGAQYVSLAFGRTRRGDRGLDGLPRRRVRQRRRRDVLRRRLLPSKWWVGMCGCFARGPARSCCRTDPSWQLGRSHPATDAGFPRQAWRCALVSGARIACETEYGPNLTTTPPLSAEAKTARVS
jgi:transposase InsO family protein